MIAIKIKNFRSSLKTTVLTTILISLLGVGSLLAVQAYLRSHALIIERTDATVAIFQKMLADQIVVKGRDLSMAMETLLRDETVRDAFVRRDRETLSRRLVDSFQKQLKPLYGIEQFQFHLAPAICFFRVHSPGKFGDDLSGFRKTVLAVNSERKPVVGIEVGSAGPGLRVVYPIFDQEGRHVGSVEYGSSLQSIFASVAEVTGTDFAIGIDQKVFEESKRFTDKSNDVLWNDTVFYEFSSQNAKNALGTPTRTSLQQVVELDNRRIFSRAFPLSDYSNREIGHVVVFQDITAMVDQARLYLFVQIGLIVLVSILISLLIFWILNRSLLAPLDGMVRLMGDVVKGDLTIRLPVSAAGNELDVLARSANAMLGGMATNVRRIMMQSDSVAACTNELLHIKTTLGKDADRTIEVMEGAGERFKHLEGAVAKIRDDVGGANGHMGEVSSATEQLSVDIGTIAAAAEEASQNVTTMASAAEEMTANLSSVNNSLQDVNNSASSVASAVEEMTATLDEVRARCLSASQESERATRQIEDTLEVMDKLSQSAEEIGRFIELINQIADQTNMLALNASIEAAGAGEAGKGFAVVANEVKELARQTADATHLVAEQVRQIQDNTREVDAATREVSQIVGDINNSNQEITLAVDEQSAAIQEIAKALSAVTLASDDVTRNAQELQFAADEVSRAALEAAAGAGEIARSSSNAAVSAHSVLERNREASALVQSIFDETNIASASAEEVMKDVETANRMAGYMSVSVHTFTILIDVVQGAMEALRASQIRYVTAARTFDTRVVKEGHLAWLRRLEEASSGRITVQAEEAGDFRGCAFGKWYFNDGKQALGQDPLFLETGAVHEQVHQTAVEVLSKVGAGDKQGGMDSLERFRDLRGRLFILLDRLYMVNSPDERKLIEWDDSLDVGVRQFNEDHQRLIDYINALHAAMRDGLGKAKMAEILQGLTDFTLTHFAREEAAMQRHGYERYPQQKEQHVKLVAQVVEQKNAFEAGSTTVALDMLSFLQDWLIKHIKGEDMRYRPFFAAKGEQ
ncbi:MAG: bacteriohemerythrin [Magnetococcales bacterium]|nr:bacteriohemerythrin [Magnetococcales bacterium]